MVREREIVKIQLDSRVIKLLKQENLCGEVSLPILQCRVGPIFKCISECKYPSFRYIFLNISESPKYSKFYQCQVNVPNLSPWYIPPSASVQMYMPM